MNNKLIVIVSSEFPPGPGGIGKQACDLSQALAWKGYRVSVFASQDYSNRIEVDAFNISLDTNISLIPFPRQGVSTYFNRWKLISDYLKKNPPEMVIVSGRFSIWLGYLIKKIIKRSIPVHAFLHGSELNKRNLFNHFFTKLALNNIDFLWAVSAFTRTQLLKAIKRTDIRVLPNGIWMDDWMNDDKKKESFSLNGNPSLLTVGRVSARKGQYRVVEALPVIFSQFKNVHYHIAGIPSGKEKVLELAQQMKVNNLISFHGKIPSLSMLANYYKSANIFIMLSKNQKDGDTEGFGIAILEANYFGKPAIGATGCGIEDAICDGYNGRLVNGDDANEILSAINDILNNYETYSSNARNWAAKHDWKLIIEQFINHEELREEDKIAFLNK